MRLGFTYILFLTLLLSSNCKAFDKVVIWGHKLHSHTHSYIHNAFYRAFKYKGYPTYWFDDNDDVSSFDFTNSLFITEGQVDKNIPIRGDCDYILHNCDNTRYGAVLASNRAIKMQVYSDSVRTHKIPEVEKCIHFDVPNKIVYMPWATDLLPSEIEGIQKKVSRRKKAKAIYWIGTIGAGVFGNIKEIEPFQRAATNDGISFIQKCNVSISENQKLISMSYMAPTIVGTFQQKVGYIPCRIFKNISYGQMGITNSYRVYELFEKR